MSSDAGNGRSLRPMGISPEFGFFRLGTEQAGNLHTWQTGVTMQADRVREGIEAARGHDDAAREASLRLDADAHFLLVAARSGMRFAERVQAVTKDERLAEAMAAFAEAFPDTTDLRDVLTHIDECVLNQGHLQPGGRSRRKGEVQDGSFSIRAYTNDGDVVVAFGPFAVKLLGRRRRRPARAQPHRRGVAARHPARRRRPRRRRGQDRGHRA